MSAVTSGPRFSHVDDATAMRASLSLLLPDLTFVSSHGSVEDLLTAMPEADVVILDLHLANTGQPDASQGTIAIRRIVEAGYRVCVYSQEERRFVLAACLAAGATGVVSKAASLAEAEAAFRAVAADEPVIPPDITGLIEVLAHRARGLTYAEMSRSMYLSESTLRGYWMELAQLVSQYLRETSPGDIEHALGLRPGDLLDLWPGRGPTS